MTEVSTTTQWKLTRQGSASNMYKNKLDGRKTSISLSPSSEKSYLKSRRARHRQERRSEILGIVDRNLEDDPTLSVQKQKGALAAHLESSKASIRTQETQASSITSPLNGRNNHNSFTSLTSAGSSIPSRVSNSPGGSHWIPNSPPPKLARNQSQSSMASRRNSNGALSPESPDKQGRRTSRLNSLVSVFRKNRLGDSDHPPKQTSPVRMFRRLSHTQATNQQQQQILTPEQIEAQKQEQKLLAVVESVLRKYPKSGCKTYTDHRDFAFAALTTEHSPDLNMDRETLAKLRVLLEIKLKERLSQMGVNVDTTPDVNKRDRAATKGGSRRSNIASQSPKNKRNTLSKNSSDTPERYNTSKIVRDRKVHYNDERKHEEVESDDTDDETLFVVKSSTRSLDDRHPGSSKCLNVPFQPKVDKKTPSLLKPKQDDEDNTSRTDSTDVTADTSFASAGATSMPLGSILTPQTSIVVKDLLLLDSSGHVGSYTGPICPTSGKPHGKGKLVPPSGQNGKTYEGDWDQGHWCGVGRLTKANGDVYEGHFLDDQKHGHGVYIYADGKRRFDGRYVMGQRVEGTMMYGDNSVYKGQWYNGKRHGRGMYKFGDGSRYKGEFDRDRIHGIGQLVWPDGSKYVGEWCKGQRHGMGKDYDKTGALRREGMWKNGKPPST